MCTVMQGGVDGAVDGVDVGFVGAVQEAGGEEGGVYSDGAGDGVDAEPGRFGGGGRSRFGLNDDGDRAGVAGDGEEVEEGVGSLDGAGAGMDDCFAGLGR